MSEPISSGVKRAVSAAPEYQALFGADSAQTLALYRHHHDHAHDHHHHHHEDAHHHA